MEESFYKYKRRDPERAILYQVLQQNMEQFFQTVESNPDQKSLPYFVKKEFEKFLSCGLLRHGFVRLKCYLNYVVTSMLLKVDKNIEGLMPTLREGHQEKKQLYYEVI